MATPVGELRPGGGAPAGARPERARGGGRTVLLPVPLPPTLVAGPAQAHPSSAAFLNAGVGSVSRVDAVVVIDPAAAAVPPPASGRGRGVPDPQAGRSAARSGGLDP